MCALSPPSPLICRPAKYPILGHPSKRGTERRLGTPSTERGVDVNTSNRLIKKCRILLALILSSLLKVDSFNVILSKLCSSLLRGVFELRRWKRTLPKRLRTQEPIELCLRLLPFSWSLSSANSQPHSYSAFSHHWNTEPYVLLIVSERSQDLADEPERVCATQLTQTKQSPCSADKVMSCSVVKSPEQRVGFKLFQQSSN